MEGRSVLTTASCCSSKSDQGFITPRQLAVAEEPCSESPLMFKLRVRQSIKPTRDSAKCLRNLIKEKRAAVKQEPKDESEEESEDSEKEVKKKKRKYQIGDS